MKVSKLLSISTNGLGTQHHWSYCNKPFAKSKREIKQTTQTCLSIYLCLIRVVTGTLKLQHPYLKSLLSTLKDICSRFIIFLVCHISNHFIKAIGITTDKVSELLNKEVLRCRKTGFYLYHLCE